MDEQPPKRRSPWSSLFSLLVFVLVVAGQPLASLVHQVLNSGSGAAISIPWPNLIPFAIGALVIIGAVVVIARAIGGAARGPQIPLQTPYRLSRSDPQLPAPPRFEPIISPQIVLIGIVGVLILGSLALALAFVAVP